jgi:hypothetical protein
MISTKEMLTEVRAEIARLQKLEQALIEAAGGGQGPAKSRISPEGAAVIAAAARLRHARKSGDKAAIRRFEKEVTRAKAAAKKAKA